MTDILELVWLVGLTAYLGWLRYRGVQAVSRVRDLGARHQRLETLKARRSDLEGLLTRMQSGDAETRVKAAREAIHQRAGR